MAHATPALGGQSGLILMPDGRISEDGTWQLGLSTTSPYQTLWTSLTVLPWLEATGRFTQIKGVPGFGASAWSETYGDYKDKTFDLKALLTEESEHMPAISVGIQDIMGTGIFRSEYIAASKKFGAVDLTLGYGINRINGVFGGIRYTPEWGNGLGFVAEWDANDYPNDLHADQSGVKNRTSASNIGIEYKYKDLNFQLGQSYGSLTAQISLSVPLGQKRLSPRNAEPAPDTEIGVRPDESEWSSNADWAESVVRKLRAQDFREIRLAYSEDRVLKVYLTNVRISNMPRAVSRAARIVLNGAPQQVKEIEITYHVLDMPVATYTFLSPATLDEYFSGLESITALSDTVAITAPKNGMSMIPSDKTELNVALTETRDWLVYGRGEGGNIFSAWGGDPGRTNWSLVPRLTTYINDPSGALRFNVFGELAINKKLAPNWYATSSVHIPLYEDVSKVTTPSNSNLPHVRTSISEYTGGHTPKLAKLLLNRYWSPATRTYARASIGLYEEMYGGVGAQILRMSTDGKTGLDLSVDWLKQREPNGLGFEDYTTVQVLGGAYWKTPVYGITLSTKVGQFLAKDKGARFEARRKFASGWEAGVWYTVTNGNDITSPGTPSSPYRDKGIFLKIPLESALPKDTQERSSLTFSPWTRDVGQIVQSPDDLYYKVEQFIGVADEAQNPRGPKQMPGLTEFGE